MGQTIIAERTQTDVPVSVQVSRDGGIAALTIEAKFFNGADSSEWLDFDDGVFKAAGHVDDTIAVPEVNATEVPGLYAIDGGFDLSGITLPAATRSILVQYDITAGGETGNDTDTIELVRSILDVPAQTWLDANIGNRANRPTLGELLAIPDVADVNAGVLKGAVWDTILQGNTHNVNNSAGRILRQLKEGIGTVLDEGDFRAGSTTTTAVLALTAPAVDASLPGSLLVDNVQNTFWVITAYNGTTKVATIAPDRGITPANGDAYIVAGSVFSVPLSDALDVIRDAILSDATTFAGANIDAAISSRESEASAAARQIIDVAEHDATQVAIAAIPAAPSAGVIADAVWDEALAAHLAAGSFGELMSRVLGFAAQDNVRLDGGPLAADPTVPEYDTAGLMIFGRIRVFDTAANAAASTPGNVAAETGELFRQEIDATSTTPGQADSYLSRRVL